MATIVTREFGTTAKGSPLTNQELDNNFTNLNAELTEKLSYKQPVKYATTTNITLNGVQTVDGFSTTQGIRVLVKDQNTKSENGIYTIGFADAWTRVADANTAAELANSVVAVELGNVNSGRIFRTNFLSTQTLGTTDVIWNEVLTDRSPYKAPVIVATTANITLSGTQTIDTVGVIPGNRVLVKDQSTTTQNGIYVVSAGTWTRSQDADTSNKLAGAIVPVLNGVTNVTESFKCNFSDIDTLGTSPVLWHRLLLVEGESVLLGKGTTGAPQLSFPAGTLTSTPQVGAVEYDGFHHTVVGNNGLGRVPISGPIFTSGIGTAGGAANTNYALFPAPGDTITLPVGTYFYETSFRVSVATSITASTLALSLRGSGTAVGTQTYNGTSLIATTGTALFQAQVPATALTGSMVVTNTSSVSGRAYTVSGRGILKITTAGTIIPSYVFSGTLTDGTTSLLADNYMMIQPLSPSGTAIQTGAWA